MTFRIASLDRTLTLKPVASLVADAHGVKVPSAPASITVRAQLLSNSYGDKADDGSTTEQDSLRFRLRYLAAVSVGDQVTYDGAAYKVKAITVIGRRRFLEINLESST